MRKPIYRGYENDFIGWFDTSEVIFEASIGDIHRRKTLYITKNDNIIIYDSLNGYCRIANEKEIAEILSCSEVDCPEQLQDILEKYKM